MTTSRRRRWQQTTRTLEGRIAIIGMAGRFPGAADLGDVLGQPPRRASSRSSFFIGGRAARRRRAARATSATRPTCAAAAPLDDIDQFDAAFFGMSPRDAAVFDPQHRLFLECAWEAFEHAGYVGERIDGAGRRVRVVRAERVHVQERAGQRARRRRRWASGWCATPATTRTSSPRGSPTSSTCTGPSMNVQTACCSTLVAVHLACQSLLSGECDMALAGGAVVAPVQHRGYLYKEGEILSPDGHCRAFDAKSAGTVISSAVGCVRPQAAGRTRSTTATTCSRSFAARPSTTTGGPRSATSPRACGGQARGRRRGAGRRRRRSARRLVRRGPRHRHADRRPDRDRRPHAGVPGGHRRHGSSAPSARSSRTSATPARPPASPRSSRPCWRSSTREIPPSLHYETPNPQADFPNSPFFVNAALRPWEPGPGGTAHRRHHRPRRRRHQRPRHRRGGAAGRRRSGPSAPGPAAHRVGAARPTSARAGRRRSGRPPAGAPRRRLADVAYTLLAGRKAFAVAARRRRRRTPPRPPPRSRLAAKPIDAAPSQARRRRSCSCSPAAARSTPGMGRELYEHEPVYRERRSTPARGRCEPELGSTCGRALFPAGESTSRPPLERPSVALPALFATEYAMARLLQSWGVEPAAMIGHSAGEYAAACLAGVVTHARTAWPSSPCAAGCSRRCRRGRCSACASPRTQLRDLLPAGLEHRRRQRARAVRGLGSRGADRRARSRADGARRRTVARIHIDVAAHSSMLEPILAEFGAFCRTIRFSAPADPVRLEPHRHVDHGRGGDRPGLLGAAPAPAPCASRDGIDAMLADAEPGAPGGRPGPHAGRPGPSGAGQAGGGGARRCATRRRPASDVAFALGAARAGVGGGRRARRRRALRRARRAAGCRCRPIRSSGSATGSSPMPPDTRAGRLRRASCASARDIDDWFSTPSWRRSIAGAGVAEPRPPARSS